jgi:nitroimidazol reductase NimA-like FMN-containing flavoprotein (pyridoxamine 5'-phosphate oxidase superfamily)
MVAAMTSRGLEVLDTAECYALLRSRSLGRVGVAIAGDVAVLPVYYAVVDDDIVFRTDTGMKLHAATSGMGVVFEVDGGVPGWSVLVKGHAQEIRDHAGQSAARTALGHDWPAGKRDSLVRISAERVSGRRLPPRT